MDDSPKKSTRELVTLPPDLAERVEAFRAKTGMMSKSESLKMLIEGGLRRYDTRGDLFARCKAASAKGQSLGDIITFVTADHPLVQSTRLDSDSLIVTLRNTDPDLADQQFRFSRARKKWFWEYVDRDGDWVELKKEHQEAASPKAELDDDIPF